MAHASLRISGPQGAVDLTIEVAQAVSLSTRVGKTLGVAEDLIESVAEAGESLGVPKPPAALPPASPACPTSSAAPSTSDGASVRPHTHYESHLILIGSLL
jgi:hypothetical protein